MYTVEDSKQKGSWNLAHPDDEQVEIDENKLKLLDHHDLLAINFLYQNYKKNYKGAVLNEQNGFHMQLQVSVFLNVMLKCIEQKFMTLILAPDYFVEKWYQYLTEIADLITIKVNSKTCPEDFDDKHGVALLISFDDLNLLKDLVSYNFFAVVIDCFDEVAKKMIIKKLSGDFHIGLTTRNFYLNPDQRLQWMMINWCCPGCCGESKDFCRIDNDNFSSFRDNYRRWWFRLTRHFCDSLKDVDIDQAAIINKSVKTKSSRNRKTTRTIKSKNKLAVKSTPVEECMEIGPVSQSQLVETHYSDDSNEAGNAKDRDVQTNDDPLYLLLSRNRKRKFVTDIDSPVHVKTEDNDSNDTGNVLLSLIDGVTKQENDIVDTETEISIKKKEILSQIFSDDSSGSRTILKEEGSEFLTSLID